MTATCSDRARAWVRAAPAALALALALVAPAPVRALSTDRDQPISIEADRAEADDARRVTIYRGNVVITQGSLRISGDTVTIHYNADQTMSKLVSVGEPARFRQLPDGSTEYKTARAKRMEYYSQKDLIVLLGDASYGQGKDLVSADRIVYDSRLARFKAQSVAPVEAGAGGSAPAAKPPSRVKITIMPKHKK